MDTQSQLLPEHMESDPNATGDDAGSPTSNSKMKKRTKTGCLTCRKRRIKCGEERPTCANCTKSKRQCEGYQQRVIFKRPLGNWPDHPGVVSTLQYHNSSLPGSKSNTQPQDTTVTSIQPRPLIQFEFAAENHPTIGHLNTQQAFERGHEPYGHTQYQQPLPSPHHQLPTPTSATLQFPQISPVNDNFHGQYEPSLSYPHQQYAQAQYQQIPASQATQQAYYQQAQVVRHPIQQSAYIPQSSVSPQNENFPTQYRYKSHDQPSVQHAEIGSTGYNLGHPLAATHADASSASFQSAQVAHHAASEVKYMPAHAVYEQLTLTSPPKRDEPLIPLSGFGGEDHVSPTQVLDEAAVEEVDDDYYDIHSDEEMLDVPEEADEDADLLGRDFSLIKSIHHEHTGALTVRRYDAFIYDGILSHYRTEQVANPLKNPKTARVFAHFIHVTGPSLSIYERNPRNPTSIFEGPTPASQQSLWTYVLPLKALGHQSLLHAMLAMASLHIAKLQRGSITPSYKHYAYALKRLGRSLGNPKKRLSVATLATSVLLGFYEVMTAEHVKWGTHIMGCAQLISELDFSRLAQEARRLKAARTEEDIRLPYHNPGMLIDQTLLSQRLEESSMMPDENIVSIIMGRKISYDDFGRVLGDTDGRKNRGSRLPDKLDLRTYEHLQDLYWFYARQDAFQSMVSGNPLITSFRKWSDGPPRAPLGQSDALYGTHDHIILLVARISDFTVRDRTRKLKQMEADGGQWRPRPGVPGMSMGPPPTDGGRGGPPKATGPPPPMKGMRGPSFGPPSSRGSTGPPHGPPPSNTMPNFYGMAPSQPHKPLSSSYAKTNHKLDNSPKTSHAAHPKFTDLPAAYEAALADWTDISHAHATIARILANSEAFAPLTSDLYPVAPGGNMTPFGPALLYRSYDISALWTLLHLSNILLLRSHPAGPAAAHVAAGVCAQATQPYATLIGRISAGMQMPTSDDMPLSPFLGAALIETTMALFFAGIQYRDPGQRAWIIKRLLDVDRRTGWASAAVIARGCETSWEKAAEMGRGPPYMNRKTSRHGEPGPIVLDADDGGVAAGGWGVGTSLSGSHEEDIGDRRFVVGRSRPTPWAKNLMATDEDLRADMENVGLGGE